VFELSVAVSKFIRFIVHNVMNCGIASALMNAKAMDGTLSARTMATSD
jgi:hypothetical protein